MKFYHKLSSYEKFKRTIYAGIPLLILSSIIIIYLAPTIQEKIIVPVTLLIIWLIQLLYTFKNRKNDKNL